MINVIMGILPYAYHRLTATSTRRHAEIGLSCIYDAYPSLYYAPKHLLNVDSSTDNSLIYIPCFFAVITYGKLHITKKGRHNTNVAKLIHRVKLIIRLKLL